LIFTFYLDIVPQVWSISWRSKQSQAWWWIWKSRSQQCPHTTSVWSEKTVSNTALNKNDSISNPIKISVLFHKFVGGKVRVEKASLLLDLGEKGLDKHCRSTMVLKNKVLYKYFQTIHSRFNFPGVRGDLEVNPAVENSDLSTSLYSHQYKTYKVTMMAKLGRSTDVQLGTC
jgi:hypothetical protein